jgi:adenosylcobyric acid synthase
MSLMVLGTSSHVGKSTVVAAICRAMVKRGIQVAPFKSQNMSLNSYVTVAGEEIGIAQAMQAFAACLEPEADMNPILLKPKAEKASQVVLLGHPWKDVRISEYYRETDFLLRKAMESARRLEDRYGSLVVEGAGGAAEVNLYDRDIANIRLARELMFPILLVADIERGGVFAQVYGTLSLLPPDIRPLVIGVIVNKFRGDPELFRDGVKILEDLCGVPVLGVLPHTPFPLPSEDSLSIGDKKSSHGPVRIGIIRLRHISNFTDFEKLEAHATVDYIPPGGNLDGYDCLIIPGTKNTIEDLQELLTSGTAVALIRARERGVPIIGICGGYQMLSATLIDSGVESREGVYPGLGLLSAVTRFGPYHKKTVQVERTASPVGPILSRMGKVRGYEIHMGETERGSDLPAFQDEGAVSPDGLVFGTYLHGLFENPGAVNALLSYLFEKKGAPFTPVTSTCGEDPYEALCSFFSEHVDIDVLAIHFP